MGAGESSEKKAAAAKAEGKAAAPAAASANATPAAAPATAETPEHPEKKRMSVMSKHLQEYMGDSEAQKKQWMQHFGVNAAGDIVNKKRHDSAVAGMVGAVDNEGNLIDAEKFKKACEAIKAGADAKAQAKTKDPKGKGKSKPSNEIGSKICVRNLHEDTTKEKLKELFQGFGTVATVDLKTKEGGKCKGFGFVQFRSAEEASKAMADMHDKEVEGKKLAVTLAFDSQEKGADDPKGKGKSKENKGKGKGKGKKGDTVTGASPDQQQNQYQAAYQMQQYNWWLLQNQAAMQWQMYMQAQTAAMYNASPQASIAAVSAAAADTPMYEGEIKSVSTRNDYGFIDCEALRGKYPDKKNPSGRAVYVDISSLPETHKCVGAKVKFSLTFNSKGHPRAGLCVPQ